MPITKSAKKALRKDIKRRLRNIWWQEKIKKIRKKIRKLIQEKKIEEAKRLLSQFYKIIDKAAKNNVLKKNTASRLKSRTTLWLNKQDRK